MLFGKDRCAWKKSVFCLFFVFLAFGIDDEKEPPKEQVPVGERRRLSD